MTKYAINETNLEISDVALKVSELRQQLPLIGDFSFYESLVVLKELANSPYRITIVFSGEAKINYVKKFLKASQEYNSILNLNIQFIDYGYFFKANSSDLKSDLLIFDDFLNIVQGQNSLYFSLREKVKRLINHAMFKQIFNYTLDEALTLKDRDSKGFNRFNLNEEELIKLATIYYQTYGDLDMPDTFLTNDGINEDKFGYPLGKWIATMRIEFFLGGGNKELNNLFKKIREINAVCINHGIDFQKNKLALRYYTPEALEEKLAMLEANNIPYLDDLGLLMASPVNETIKMH